MIRRSFLARLGALVAPTLVPVLLSACASTPATEVPTQLLGRWITDSEGYEGKEFQFTGDRLMIRLGGPTLNAQPIESVEISPFGIRTEFRVHFRNEEGLRDHMVLRYENRDGVETIRLRNMELVVWQKVGAGSNTPEATS